MTAPVTFHAETFVSLVAVRGGVLDAPRSRDCRGWLGADVWRGRLYLRQPRRASLASTAPRMQYRGRSPRTILYGRTDVSNHPTPGGRGSPPLRGEWGTFRRGTGVVRRPKAGRRGRRPLRAVCLLQVAAFDVRAQPARLWYGRTEAVLHPRPGGRGSPPLRCEWEGIGAEPALSAASRILSSASHAVQPLPGRFLYAGLTNFLSFRRI